MKFDEARRKTKIMPYGERVKVYRDVPGDVTDSGILIPEDSTKKLNSGVVIESSVQDIRSGCCIIWNDFAGIDVEDNDGKMYVLLETKDIIAFEADR